MRAVCDRANAVSHLSKKYQRACQLLHVTQYLKTPFFLPCVIEDFDDDGAMLKPVHLQHVKRTQRRITYSSLSLSDKPWVCSLIYTPCLNNRCLLYLTYSRSPFSQRNIVQVAFLYVAIKWWWWWWWLCRGVLLWWCEIVLPGTAIFIICCWKLREALY